MKMNKTTITRRIRRIRRQLNNKRISCLLLTKPANVTYVTGFSGDDSWAVVTGRVVYLLTDSRYTEQAKGECPQCRIIERDKSLSQALAKLPARLKTIRTLSVEKSTSLAAFDAVRKHVKGRIRTVADIVENVRSNKDGYEIALIRKAASIAAQALKRTRRHIRPGATESEVAGRLNFEMRRLGATSSFDTIVAFGANASRPHHQPTTKKLKRNDTLLIDFGARYKGYCSDITRCFAVGEPSALYKKCRDAVAQAQAAAIGKVKAGARIADVDRAAREVIAGYDLPVYGHGTGHGLGLEIHEPPFLRADAKGKLKAGQVITIEPGVYIPGKLGVRTEDDVLVTEDGCKILTHSCPHELS